MKTRILRFAGLAIIIGTAAGAFASGGDGQKPLPPTPPDTSKNASPTTSLIAPSAAAQKAQPRLSPWASQVQRLALAGVDEDVITSYIDTAGTFNLTPEQIINLTQSGVPRTIITAMIQHDNDIFTGVRQVQASTVPESIPLLPPSSKSTVTTAATPSSSPAASPPPFEEYPPDFFLGPLEDFYTPAEMQERSPVRKPYAVPLTAPILVWRLP